MSSAAAIGADRASGTAAGSGRAGGVLSPTAIAILVGIGLAFVAVFFRWFLTQHKLSWNNKEDWAHAYLIPLISGWLLWRKREVLAKLPTTVFLPGLAPLLFGVASYFFMVLGFPNHMMQGVSWIVAFYGVVLLLFGPAFARAAFIPIGYLVFAITVSEIVMIELTFQLQLIASQGSWVMLGLFGAIGGFTVDLDGNTLVMVVPKAAGGFVEHPLNVAEACSGMRMVIAFLALSVAVALASCSLWWQRIATVMLAIPVAVFMNMVRVTTLGLLTLIDPNLAAGDAHTVIGTILLVPSLAAFLGIVWLLNRMVKPAGDDEGETEAGSLAGAQPVPRRVSRWGGFRVSPLAGVPIAVVLLASAGGFAFALQSGGVILEKSRIDPPNDRRLTGLPTETENWERLGADRVEVPEVVEVLGTENYLTRSYRRKEPAPDGRRPILQLHAAYYTGLIDAVPHVPERCFIGGGLEKGGRQVVLDLPMDTSRWIPDTSVPEEFAGESGVVFTARTDPRFSDAVPPAKRVRLPRDVGPDRPIRMACSEFLLGGDARLYAGYFFIANGGTVARAEGVRTLAFDLTSDYAYFLKVQVTSDDSGSAERLVEDAGELIGELMPEIMRCVPDWIEVELGNYPPGSARGAGGAERGA